MGDETEKTLTDDVISPQNVDIKDIDIENYEEEFDTEFENVKQNIIHS